MSTAAKQTYDAAGAPKGVWDPPTTTPSGVAPEMVARWRSAVTRVCEIAKEQNWTRAEFARQSGVPGGTLTPLLDGVYTGSYGNQVVKLENWLAAFEQDRTVFTLPDVPAWYATPTSTQLIDLMLYAQAGPQMAVVTLASGLGKSTTANKFRSRPGVYMATMRPTTGGTNRMLQEIAYSLDIDERSPMKLDRAIGAKIKRNGRQTLLILDEAQNLSDEAINQLRYFYDIYGCGIALLGNEEIYARYGGRETREGYGQIHRRIGLRMRRMAPLAGDIEATIDAWGVEDKEARRLLAHIGRKPGTLGQIAETMKLASVLAAGEAGKGVEVRHIRQAWENRGGEEARS